MSERQGAVVVGRVPVSVIIPCYRCADTIQRAVASVIKQTRPPAEIILVDDFSDDADHTLDALEQLCQASRDAKILIVQLARNCGPGSARNAGWEAASQPYLAFLDADDSWHPRKLEIQYQWMVAHPQVVLSGHRSLVITEGNSLPELPEKVSAHQVDKRELLLVNCFPTRSVILKREISFRFVPEKRYAEDYLLWLTVVCSGQSAWFLDMPLAYSFKGEFGDGGLTGNLRKAQQGVIDAYSRLYMGGVISWPCLVMVLSFSWLKYLRRVAFVRCGFHKAAKRPESLGDKK